MNQPKFITRRVYKTEYKEDGVQVKLLNAGEAIDITDKTLIRRI